MLLEKALPRARVRECLRSWRVDEGDGVEGCRIPDEIGAGNNRATIELCPRQDSCPTARVVASIRR